MNSYGPICIICLRRSESGVLSASPNDNFLKFCRGYLKMQVPVRLSNGPPFCEECDALISETLELHKQYILVNLMLTRKVTQLGNRMPRDSVSIIDKDPMSKGLGGGCSLEELKLKCFRKELRRKCHETGMKILPTVSIKRLNYSDLGKPARDLMVSLILLYCIHSGVDFVALTNVALKKNQSYAKGNSWRKEGVSSQCQLADKTSTSVSSFTDDTKVGAKRKRSKLVNLPLSVHSKLDQFVDIQSIKTDIPSPPCSPSPSVTSCESASHEGNVTCERKTAKFVVAIIRSSSIDETPQNKRREPPSAKKNKLPIHPEIKETPVCYSIPETVHLKKKKGRPSKRKKRNTSTKVRTASRTKKFNDQFESQPSSNIRQDEAILQPDRDSDGQNSDHSAWTPEAASAGESEVERDVSETNTPPACSKERKNGKSGDVKKIQPPSAFHTDTERNLSNIRNLRNRNVRVVYKEQDEQEDTEDSFSSEDSGSLMKPTKRKGTFSRRRPRSRRLPSPSSETPTTIILPYGCQYCEARFRNSSMLYTHTVKSHQGGDEKFSLTCNSCSTTFPSGLCLLKHLRDHQKCQDRADRKFFCRFCSASFTTQQFHDVHMRCRHWELSTGIPCDAENCSEIFPSSEELKTHLRSHGETFECAKCGLGFLSEYRLKLHQINHIVMLKSKSFRCSVTNCRKKFSSRSVLLHHFHQTHGKIKTCKVFRCETCGDFFITPQMANLHSRFCTKGNKGPPLLRRIADESTKAPFPCPFCGKTFLRKNNLKAHARKEHHGKVDKSCFHICPECRKEFMFIDELTAHLKYHRRKYACHLCIRRFDRPRDFRDHLRVHSGERLKCDWCPVNYSVTALQKLRIHMNKCHPEEYAAKPPPPKTPGVYVAKRLKCDWCPAIRSKPRLKFHARKFHPKEYATAMLGSKEIGTVPVEGEESGDGLEHTSLDTINFHCPTCAEGFTHASNLCYHILHAHAEPDDKLSLECSICQSSHLNVQLLSKHLKEHHEILIEKTKFCHFCPAAFTTEQLFQIHMKTSHWETISGFPCEAENCSELFLNFQERNDHLKSHHLSGDDLLSVCNRCGLGFLTEYRLRLHKFVHEQGRSKRSCIICKVKGCIRAFRRRFQLMDHYNAEHADPKITLERCQGCDHVFTTKQMLQIHQTICAKKAVATGSSNQEVIMYCRRCPKVCYSKEAMDHHKCPTLSKKECEGSKCICDECGITLANDERLRAHKLRHRLQQVKCEHCQRIFKNKITLNLHIARAHTEGEKYICHICGKGWPTQDQLKHHTRGHEMRYSCHICQKRFSQPWVLKLHLRTHTGQKLKCEWCENTYSAPGSVKIHIKACHPEEFERHFPKGEKTRYRFNKLLVKPLNDNVDADAIDSESASRNESNSLSSEIQPIALAHEAISKDEFKTNEVSTNLQSFTAPGGATPLGDDDCQDFDFEYPDFGLGETLQSDHEEKSEDPSKTVPASVETSTVVEKCDLQFSKEGPITPAPTELDEIKESHSSKTAKAHRKRKRCRSVNVKRPFPCFSCSKRFPTTGVWFNHTVQAHKGGSENLSLECDTCQAELESVRFLMAHLTECHEDRYEKIRKFCHFCSKSFVTEQFYQIHMKLYHWELSTAGIPCEAENCSEMFSSAPERNEHLKSHNDGLVIVCDTCGLGFMTAYRLQLHQLGHTQVSRSAKTYPCAMEGCGRMFFQTSMLVEHYNEAHAEPCDKVTIFRCSKCDVECFTTQQMLASHLQICTGESDPEKATARKEGIECPNCKKSLSATGMKSHLRFCRNKRLEQSETTKDPAAKWICELCGESYLRQRNLKQHHMSAHWDPQFECEYCSRKFTREDSMRYHIIRKHKRENLLICDICGAGRPTRSALAAHKKEHEEIYGCHFCPKQFSRRTTLRLHLMSHSGERFKCEWCSNTYSAPGNVKSHIRVCHPEQFSVHFQKGVHSAYRFSKLIVKPGETEVGSLPEPGK